ncbi:MULTISPECIES: hypothetical protein [unclassified Hyphomonas]|uniref:hypothetical protein n=1 Tax=unclassified Hyphomonas TaxID=2630699 RepID=UPI001112265E|nr:MULTISPECIES: hypothetical protein [unclassified Hyphomonas]
MAAFVPVRALMLLGLAAFWSMSAWAAYVQTVTLTGEGAEEVPTQTISFAPATGTVETIEVVETEDEDDDRVFLVITMSDDATMEGTLTIGDGDEANVIGTPALRDGEALSIDVATGATTISGTPSGADYDYPLIGQPSWGLHLGAGIREMDTPEVGFGLVLRGGLESFVVVTEPETEFETLNGGFFYNNPNYGGFSLNYEYGEDDSVVTGSVAAGTDDTGNVNLDFNPNDDTTGILYGASGLDVQVRHELEYWRIGGTFFPLDTWDLAGGIKWTPKFEFTHLEQTSRGVSLPPAFSGDISDTRSISIEGDYLDLGLDIFRPFYLNENFKWWPRVEFGAQHANLELNAQQDFICIPCGPGADFQLDVNSEDDLVTWYAGIGVGAAFMFDTNGSSTPDVMLYGDAGYRTRGDGLGVFIPSSGDDLFVDNRPAMVVDDGDFDETAFRIGIVKSF